MTDLEMMRMLRMGCGEPLRPVLEAPFYPVQQDSEPLPEAQHRQRREHRGARGRR